MPAVLRGVLFDLDDTLLDHSGPVRSGITGHLADLGVDAPAGAAEQWQRIEDRHFARYLAGDLDWAGQRRARVHDMVRWLGLEPLASHDDVDAWFDGYRLRMEAGWTVFADTLAALDAMAAVRTGVVTNNESANTARKIALVGLDGRFPAVICAGVDLPGKPDPSIFLAGCNAIGTAPGETAYVGDRLHTDAVAARDAGLLGVWLDRHGDGSLPLPDGVVRVRTLHEVVAVVSHRQAGDRAWGPPVRPLDSSLPPDPLEPAHGVWGNWQPG